MTHLKSMLAFFFLLLSSAVWAQSSPVPMLESSANKIISTLQQNKSKLKSQKELIYSAVKQNLLPIVDVQGMSRSVLGRAAWNKATPAERKQFSQEFIQLVIRTYASPLANYSDEKIKFLPIRGNLNSRFIRVNSVIIRSSGPDIPVNYSLVAKGNGWKVYDMSVEGVSLLQSFRSQFTQSLQGSNIKALISEMQNHNIKAG